MNSICISLLYFRSVYTENSISFYVYFFCVKLESGKKIKKQQMKGVFLINGKCRTFVCVKQPMLFRTYNSRNVKL